MIDRLKALFRHNDEQAEAGPDVVQLAVASLFVKAAELDGDFGSEERSLIAKLLSGHYGMAEAEAAKLIERASHRVGASVEMYGLTRDIKNALDHGERIDLMEMLWQVAYADGVLHEYEANLMRRLAGLLYVTDQESGEARKRAQSALGLLE
ncbi:tellurite resistance TerB family protein [Limibacillus halophilus]